MKRRTYRVALDVTISGNRESDIQAALTHLRKPGEGPHLERGVYSVENGGTFYQLVSGEVRTVRAVSKPTPKPKKRSRR